MRKHRNRIGLCACCMLLSVLQGCNSSGELKINEQSMHHEYGEATHEQRYEQDALWNITYPVTQMPAIDDHIQTILIKHKEEFAQDLHNNNTGEKAELNIDYQSYVKEDRYISIKLDIFTSIQGIHEEIETIVYDQENEVFVHIQDLMKEDGLEYLSTLVRDDFAANYPEECETQNFMVFTAPSVHNFEHFVLRKDAIVFYFDEGTLFDHSAYIEIPYDDLAEVMDLREEERYVFVPYQDILNEPVKNIDPDQPMVALTFDDGPTARYTLAILDALKEHHASATFFVLGSRADDFPEILQRMVLEGNEIGNHTFSHKQLTTLSKERVEDEIIATQESIHNVTNMYPQTIRPPYGSKNETVMECAQGRKIVTWTIDTQDWRYRDSERIVSEVVSQVKDGDIILMHDLYATTAEAAIILIPKLQEMGYQLVTVSELYEYGKNEAGKIME